jgi:hypothetical protein
MGLDLFVADSNIRRFWSVPGVVGISFKAKPICFDGGAKNFSLVNKLLRGFTERIHLLAHFVGLGFTKSVNSG